MRRSKSNPAKYAKNYRSISQRRMTQHDELDDEQEMERLREILRDSGARLAAQGAVADEEEEEKPRQRKRKRGNGKQLESDGEALVSAEQTATEDRKNKEGEGNNILSAELMEDYGDDEDPLSQRKKKQPKKKIVQLTPEELKQAAALQKKTERKLCQLEQRAAQKKKRATLYAKLQESAFVQSQLLLPSADLGKRLSQREILQKLLQKERAGLALSEAERNVLYRKRDGDDKGTMKQEDYVAAVRATTTVLLKDTPKKGQEKMCKLESANPMDDNEVSDPNASSNSKDVNEANEADTSDREPVTWNAAASGGVSLAAQMMASLTTLKKDSAGQSEKAAQEREEAEQRRREDEERMHKNPASRYVPSNPVEIKTTQSYEKVIVEPKMQQTAKKGVVVRQVQRPPDVAAMRYDLPVAAMEFDVMDAIRNYDVTILCAETGSGKSTQVPQFLYEAGLSLVSDSSDAASESSATSCIIGVTQPRRVAAVSTAKRVCHEMGCGNGQSISNNNRVAYQTRYETAGLGSRTHIKFMTDGILLQEIQSDMLLRKYSVIVLDEAHERNLNTDVLVGLLSAALPLRKQAAKQSNLPPLKIIIMSATLRVEDFTGNKNLFSSTVPKVVKVPGRTHPVTIHHSKVTELDDYEDAAFRKTCKIHRQLPPGGILLFLTGKQEIIRMVNRLRRALNPSKDKRNADVVALNDQYLDVDVGDGDGPRDMDDDEIDGDLFRSERRDDFDEAENDEAVLFNEATASEDDDGVPKKVLVLPLYSLLSSEEQAKVFAPVPDGHRLIVVATNIAETSITIPGVSYVVDSGRQKCRNYNAETGVASFDIMWISKAAADQRAGRAGRTGPGHCYRLYSSSLYTRYMDAFALPEVLTRPLEDVVLAMKAMKISSVANFPFPTPPDRSQVDAAARSLANIGCIDLSNVEEYGGDGEITRLGFAVSRLPLGARYSKILLVAAEAGVLDYAIVVVAALSESNPFVHAGQSIVEEDDADEHSEADEEQVAETKKKGSRRWSHKGGDVLAAMLAVGAYTYAGRGAGGVSERLACQKFCEVKGLHPVVMERIQKMRKHLARLAKTRLGNAEGVAASSGGILSSTKPPNKLQESLLIQAIASGLLDNIAMLAPLGSIAGDHPFSLRSAYLSCSSSVKEPLFMDRNSVLYSSDARLLPQWVCFDTLMRKTHKNGTPVAIMKNITPIDPSWLGALAKGSRLLSLGEPLPNPIPIYDPDSDAVLCSVETKFGSNKWEIAAVKKEMFCALQTEEGKRSSHFLLDDSFRWFGRYLLEGKVLAEMKDLADMLNDTPSVISRNTPLKKVALLVSALSGAGVDSASALRKHWAEIDNKFLFSAMKQWVKADRVADFKKLWIAAVKDNVKIWKDSQ